MYEAQDALVARADLLLAVRELARPDDMEPLAVDPKSSTSGVAGGAPRRPPPMTHRESMAEASESLISPARARRRRDSIRATSRDKGLDAVLHGMLSGNRALHFGHSLISARRSTTSNTMSCGARRGRRRRRRRRPRPSPRRWQVVAHLLVRLRALASGTLSSVCDGGRPEFRLVRGFLQKDDDEDVEQDDEDADHGLFRHLAGSAAVLAASNSSRAALTVAITRPCASSARRLRDAFPHTDHAEAGAPEAAGTARSSPSIQSSSLAVPVVLDYHH